VDRILVPQPTIQFLRIALREEGRVREIYVVLGREHAGSLSWSAMTSLETDSTIGPV
jgi:hypothetical protein